MSALGARTAAAVALAAALLLAGCFGGQKRSEWAYDDIQVDELAKDGRTGQGVVIAVLDTGIDVDHPSLDHLVDGDPGDGELIAFRDYIEPAVGVEHARDPDGHGSHVIGIMSARGSSGSDKVLYGGIDLKGAAPQAQLVVARVCSGTSCDVIALPQAVRWAVEQGADVISLSLGGSSGLPPVVDQVVQDDLELAIELAIDQGVVVVAAAGNEGRRCPEDAGPQPGGDVSSPANIPHVIAVGATDKAGKVWCGSSRGEDGGLNECRDLGIPLLPIPDIGRCDPHRKPELVAPGVEILSAWAGGEYGWATGTSQAVPFVSASVALMLQGRGDLAGRADVVAVKQALVDSAQPIEGQALPHDEAAGYGLLQAAAAVRAYT